MGRIHLITGWFPVYDERGHPTGEKEFVVSHGINEETLNNVCLPWEHPKELGAARDINGEWYLDE